MENLPPLDQGGQQRDTKRSTEGHAEIQQTRGSSGALRIETMRGDGEDWWIEKPQADAAQGIHPDDEQHANTEISQEHEITTGYVDDEPQEHRDTGVGTVRHPPYQWRRQDHGNG